MICNALRIGASGFRSSCGERREELILAAIRFLQLLDQMHAVVGNGDIAKDSAHELDLVGVESILLPARERQDAKQAVIGDQRAADAGRSPALFISWTAESSDCWMSC